MFKKIFGKITGISTPLGGVSWVPSENERDVIRGMFLYIENCRSITQSLGTLRVEDDENYYVDSQIRDIRNELTDTLKKIPDSSNGAPILKLIRNSCKRYNEQHRHCFPFRSGGRHDNYGYSPYKDAEKERIISFRYNPSSPEDYYGLAKVALGELRGIVGVCLLELSILYDIEIDSELKTIIPT